MTTPPDGPIAADWQEILQAIFAPFASPDDIPKDFDFQSALRAEMAKRNQGISDHAIKSLSGQGKASRDKILADLWLLANQTSLDAKARRRLYRRVSRRYEQYFRWEMVPFPGWIL